MVMTVPNAKGCEPFLHKTFMINEKRICMDGSMEGEKDGKATHVRNKDVSGLNGLANYGLEVLEGGEIFCSGDD